jgi:hypothetical protein
MANQYVLKDRTTGDNYALKINDAQFYWEYTALPDSPEPIVEDTSLTGIYWQLFVDDKQFGWEETLTPGNAGIYLYDITGGVYWKLQVTDKEFNYIQTSLPQRYLIAVPRGRSYIAFPTFYNRLSVLNYQRAETLLSKESNNVVSHSTSNISTKSRLLS